MEHQQYKEWLLLSLYGELSDADAVLLKQHLKSCKECPAELRQLKSLHATLAKARPAPIGDVLLADARAELRAALRAERNRRAWWQEASDTIAELLAPRFRLPAAALGLLAIGVAVGYLVFYQPAGPRLEGLQSSSLSPDGASIDQGESQITNVRFISRDGASGEVEFTFDAVTPVHIRGSASDERVQKMLARAIVSEKNVGTRLRAVNFVGDQPADRQEPAKLSKEVKDALIAALKFDTNFGVKKEALRILQKYLPDPDVTNAIIYVLKYVQNTGLKIAAINSLDMSKFYQPNQDLLAMLQERVNADENSYVRIKAKAALQEARQ